MRLHRLFLTYYQFEVFKVTDLMRNFYINTVGYHVGQINDRDIYQTPNKHGRLMLIDEYCREYSTYDFGWNG